MAFFNPFCSQEAISHSNYCTLQQKEHTAGEPKSSRIKQTTPQVASKLSVFVEKLRESGKVLGISNRKNNSCFGVYTQLGSAATTAGLCRDLATFMHEQKNSKGVNPTFMAVFCTRASMSEEAFEAKVAEQLDMLQKAAEPFYCIPESLAATVEENENVLIFGSRALKVVSIYRNSSQGHLKFDYPMLAFSLLEMPGEKPKQAVYPDAVA